MKKLLIIIGIVGIGILGLFQFGIANNGIYPLKEPYLSECKTLRASIYPSFKARGDEYLKEEWDLLLVFRDKVSDVMNIEYSKYTLDMWSCAWFSKEAHRKGLIKQYRHEKNLY